MFDIRNVLSGLVSFIRYMGLVLVAMLRGAAGERELPRERKWWERPGLGIMYQIEARPGWQWDRDYVEFNRSMSDGKGGLKFNGPFCNIREWVELSQEIGVDYHIFEAKWHDGICYFDTGTTNWKTEKDYAMEFARLSRGAGIPFMYYYSAVFDHNPQFDPIQPKPRSTPSLIGNRKEYVAYIRKHYDELVGRYRPDGMWIDWYWEDGSTAGTIDHLRTRYPDVVIAFNLSNLFPSSFGRIDITSGEAHRFEGPWVSLRREDSLMVPVLTSAWKWANAFRRLFRHRWELISPAGRWWQDQSLRDDPLEIIRSLAVILACGGKLCIGATSQMDGHVFPDQVKQLGMVGAWYRPRKEYFTGAEPLRYRRLLPPGVRLSAEGFHAVASAFRDGLLLHIINRRGSTEGISITLRGRMWSEVRGVSLVPQNKKLTIGRKASSLRFEIAHGDIDPVDTILFLEP